MTELDFLARTLIGKLKDNHPICVTKELHQVILGCCLPRTLALIAERELPFSVTKSDHDQPLIGNRLRYLAAVVMVGYQSFDLHQQVGGAHRHSNGQFGCCQLCETLQLFGVSYDGCHLQPELNRVAIHPEVYEVSPRVNLKRLVLLCKNDGVSLCFGLISGEEQRTTEAFFCKGKDMLAKVPAFSHPISDSVKAKLDDIAASKCVNGIRRVVDPNAVEGVC